MKKRLLYPAVRYPLFLHTNILKGQFYFKGCYGGRYGRTNSQN